MGPGNGTQDYKPVSLRWPLLIPFILYVAGLVALVSVVSRTFPSSDDIRGDSGEGGSFQTALFTAPLINARAPAPARTPAPRKQSPSRTSHHRLFRRADNTTVDDIDGIVPGQSDSENVTAVNYGHTSPFADIPKGPDPLVGGANLTEIQQEYLAEANKTGQPIKFASRLASAPVSYLNDTTAGNQTWSPSRRFRRGPRHRRGPQDPDAYAQYSGPTQIIQPLINIFFDTNDIAYEGASWISYVGGDINNPDTAAACWATCNGPAIIFHHRYCWEEWVWYAALEQEARKTNPALAWRVIDDAYLGGTVCMSATEKQKYFPVPPEETGNNPNPDSKPNPAINSNPDNNGHGLLDPTPVLKVITLTDAFGNPTLTVTRLEASAGPLETTLTLRNSAGVPTATITAIPSGKPSLVTVRDSLGRPTATVTVPPMVETLRDEAGNPTATVTLARAPNPTTLTLTDAAGRPTLTVTITPVSSAVRGLPSKPPEIPGSQESSRLHLITPVEYVLASFLPILLVTPLCILAQTVTTSVRTYLPFHTMSAEDGGVPSAFSLTLPGDGLPGIISGVQILMRYRDPVAFLSDLLTLLLAVTAALSSEAVGVQVWGAECGDESFKGCFMGIAVFQGPNKALLALLCMTLVVLVALTLVLARWRTGLSRQDGKRVRSLKVTARLVGDGRTRDLLRGSLSRQKGEDGTKLREEEVERQLSGWKLGMGWHVGSKEEEGYGIVAIRNRTHADNSEDNLASDGSRRFHLPGKEWMRQPTTSWGTFGGLFFLIGLLALILYYETTDNHTGFEQFMLGQKFGTRIFFTFLGLVMSLFWDGYYARLSMMEPFRRISRDPQSVSTVAHVSPRAVAYTGIASHFKRQEWFLTIVAANTIIANLSPILLSNVPYNPSQTYTTHLVCAWMTAGFLIIMIITLLFGATFIGHPRLAMDPSTLAGRIYHVLDLGLLDDALLEGNDWETASLDSRGHSSKKAATFFGEEKARVEWESNKWRKEQQSYPSHRQLEENGSARVC